MHRLQELHSKLVSPRGGQIAAILIALVGFTLRVLSPETVYFNIHAERDLWRALQVLQGDRFPYLGSEMTQGGYTMGPALYFLKIPPLLFTLSPMGLLVWLAMLHGGAIYLTYRIGCEHFSVGTGLAAAALLATFPLSCLAVRYLWNPSFIFPLSTVVFWCLMDWIFKRTPRRLPIMALALSLLFQVHLSAMALIFLIAICAAVYRPPITKKIAGMTGIIVFVCFLPYLIGEVSTNFQNTRWTINPPDMLITANGAELPILYKERSMLNEGAMMALQVALSPLLYDRRYETGSFSYLHLMGEFGPQVLDSFSWRMAFRLHQLRWMYILAYGLTGLILVWMIWKNREPFTKSPGLSMSSPPRGVGIFFIVTFLVTALPPTMIATLHTLRDGEMIGVGAVRYFFIFYPMHLVALALLFRVFWRAIGGVLPPSLSGVRLVVPVLLACLLFLQGFAVLSFLRTARSIDRSFKYSLYESFGWNIQRDAADVLVTRWGVSPYQFNHHMDTLDPTFTTTRWDVISLEQGLDWAYYTHPDLDMDAEARYPDSFFVLYDSKRTPIPDLGDRVVLDRVAVGDLMLMRVDRGVEYEYSPIQNTWERLDRPRRLRR